MNEDYTKFLNTSLIELLQNIEQDLWNSFDSENQKKKFNFISSLEIRIDNEEKINYTASEIRKVRDNIENDVMNYVYKDFTQPLNNLLSENVRYEPSINYIKNMFSCEKTFDSKEFINLVTFSLANDSEIKESDIAKVIDNIPRTAKVGAILKSKDPAKTLLLALFYTYYENEYLQFLIQTHNELKEAETTSVKNAVEQKGGSKEFTTARQVLAVYYIMEELNVFAKADKTEVAKFIQFLTGKETGVSKINDTSIYKKVKSPFSKSDKQIETDLRFIRTYFEKLGLMGITNKINKEIGSKE